MGTLEKLSILDENEIVISHENSLKILEKTGIYVYSDEALKALSNEGLDIDAANKVVKFFRKIVEACLKKIPKEITLCNRRSRCCEPRHYQLFNYLVDIFTH